MQDTTGFRAGYVQLIADAVIFAAGFLLFPVPVVLWSLLGAVVLNLVIAFNHRRDRYIAPEPHPASAARVSARCASQPRSAPAASRARLSPI
nr:hypothetical protein [Psychromarinibacter sediminicola]